MTGRFFVIQEISLNFLYDKKTLRTGSYCVHLCYLAYIIERYDTGVAAHVEIPRMVGVFTVDSAVCSGRMVFGVDGGTGDG